MYLIKTDYVGGVDITAGKYYPVIETTGWKTYRIEDDRGFQISVIIGQPSARLGDTGIFELYGVAKLG